MIQYFLTNSIILLRQGNLCNFRELDFVFSDAVRQKKEGRSEGRPVQSRPMSSVERKIWGILLSREPLQSFSVGGDIFGKLGSDLGGKRRSEFQRVPL